MNIQPSICNNDAIFTYVPERRSQAEQWTWAEQPRDHDYEPTSRKYNLPHRETSHVVTWQSLRRCRTTRTRMAQTLHSSPRMAQHPTTRVAIAQHPTPWQRLALATRRRKPLGCPVILRRFHFNGNVVKQPSRTTNRIACRGHIEHQPYCQQITALK